jgi:hypothetical protein
MRLLFALAILAAVTTTAAADDPVATYAIVVGSNSGGPGQADLKYAETDAQRVGQLLVELGGYNAANVDVVVHPTPDQLRTRIGKLGDRLAEDARAGRASRVFFYYSGHARATALDLGREELPLAELRQRLFGLPAKLTVVVLDACQSGAFSRVKGAEPTADFSFNSRTQLDATGVAVLASSSGSELSQESEQLKSSYFTHHLLVGMRGASDANNDGLVTIDEAYRYAYHQTLLATAETAVGGQHVSLEVDLKGHGEVPLSFPRAASRYIELPASLEGKTLVQDKRAKTVVAETHKAKGASVRIAVAPGEYEVIVRQGTTLSRCSVSAGGIVDLSRCTNEQLDEGNTKGEGPPAKSRFRWRWRLELGGSLGGERSSAFTRNLEAFGYRQYLLEPTKTVELRLLRGGSIPWFVRSWTGVSVGHAAMPRWRQDVTGSDFAQQFDWSVMRVLGIGRVEQPFADEGFWRRFSIYGQVAFGLVVSRSTLENADRMKTVTSHGGVANELGAGLHIDSMAIRGLGLNLGYAYDYAPQAFKDLIGNNHSAGGHRLAAALTYTLSR